MHNFFTYCTVLRNWTNLPRRVVRSSNRFLSPAAVLESKKDVKTRSTNQKEMTCVTKCIPLSDQSQEKNFFALRIRFLVTTRKFIPSHSIVATIVSLFVTKTATFSVSIFVSILEMKVIAFPAMKVEAELADNEGQACNPQKAKDRKRSLLNLVRFLLLIFLDCVKNFLFPFISS